MALVQIAVTSKNASFAPWRTQAPSTAFQTSGAKLACLCSSDAVYVRQAADAAKMLTAGGAIVHLAGRPGDHEAAWRQVGVKSFIYAGCDALSTLQAAHDILDIK